MHAVNKIHQKINFEINRRKELFLFHSHYYNTDLVVFEGGLGSQILSFMELMSLRNQGIKPEINLDYFVKNDERQTSSSGGGGAI
jgi:hypothetical protein